MLAMAAPTTPASHMNFLRVNNPFTAISPGSKLLPIVQEERTHLLGVSYPYQVRVNAHDGSQPLPTTLPYLWIPAPRFRGDRPRGNDV